MNKKEYEAKCKQLDRIAKALTKLGYKVVAEDETSIFFQVDYGVIELEYGYPYQDNPIMIGVSE